MNTEKSLLTEFLENIAETVIFEVVEQMVWLRQCGVPIKGFYPLNTNHVHASAKTWPMNSPLFGVPLNQISIELFKDEYEDIRIFAEKLRQAKRNAKKLFSVNNHINERETLAAALKGVFASQFNAEPDLDEIIIGQKEYREELRNIESTLLIELAALLQKHNP